MADDRVRLEFDVDDRELDQAATKIKRFGKTVDQQMKAASSGGGFSGLMGKISSFGFAVFGAQQALGGLASVARSIGGLLSENIQFEQFSAQFETLLGSADAAEERLAELIKFGATTPFELPGVVKASITLETLTEGALSTGAGLRMVGDLAAGTGTSMTNMATIVGRLWSAMDSGRPAGEVMARLQELGVMSGKTRNQLEDMTKAGASGTEMWAVFEEATGKLNGLMDKMSSTFGGAVSNIQDGMNELKRSFFQGAFDALKPLVFDLATSLSGDGLTGAVQQAGAAFGKFISFGLHAATKAIKIFIPIVRKVTDGIRGLVAVASGMRMIRGISDGTASSFDKLGMVIGTLVGAFQLLARWIAGIFTDSAVQASILAIVDGLLALGSAIGGQLLDDFTKLVSVFGGWIEALTSSGSGKAAGIVAGFIQMLADAIKNIPEPVIKAVTIALEIWFALMIAQAAAGAFMAVTSGVIGLGTSIVQFPINAIKKISDPLSTLFNKVSGLVRQAKSADKIVDCVGLDDCAKSVGNFNDKLTELDKKPASRVFNRKIAEDVKKTGPALATPNQLKDVTRTITTKFKTDGVAPDALGGTVKIKAELSIDAIDGLRSGIAEGISTAVTQGLAKGAASSAASALGRSSGMAFVAGLTGAITASLVAAVGGVSLVAIGPAALVLVGAIIAALSVAFVVLFPKLTGIIVGAFIGVFVGIPILLLTVMTRIAVETIEFFAKAIKVTIVNLIPDITIAFVNLFSGLVTSVSVAVKDFGVNIGIVLKAIIVGDWGRAIDAGLAALKALFVTFPLDVLSVFAAFGVDLALGFAGFLATIGLDVLGALGSIAETFTTTFSNILRVVGIDMGAIASAIGGFLLDIIKFVGSWVTDFASGFEEGFNKVMELIPGKITEVVTAFTDLLFGAIRAVADTDMGEVFKAVVGFFPKLIGVLPVLFLFVKWAFSNGWSSILAVFANAFTVASSIGVEFVRGLWDGMFSLKDWITTKAGNLAQSILDSITSVFGILSPSTEGINIGQQFIRGIAIGLSSDGELNRALSALEIGLNNSFGNMSPTVKGNRAVAGLNNTTKSEINVNFHGPVSMVGDAAEDVARDAGWMLVAGLRARGVA